MREQRNAARAEKRDYRAALVKLNNKLDKRNEVVAALEERSADCTFLENSLREVDEALARCQLDLKAALVTIILVCELCHKPCLFILCLLRSHRRFLYGFARVGANNETSAQAVLGILTDTRWRCGWPS